jgi:hypothetical protein
MVSAFALAETAQQAADLSGTLLTFIRQTSAGSAEPSWGEFLSNPPPTVDRRATAVALARMLSAAKPGEFPSELLPKFLEYVIANLRDVSKPLHLDVGSDY